MKRILLQRDSDRTASVFDAVTAYDARADVLLRHGSVKPAEVRAIVHGAMLTRGGEDPKSSAVFVGGVFFGPVRVPVMLDAHGCTTPAAAAYTDSEQSREGGCERITHLDHRSHP